VKKRRNNNNNNNNNNNWKLSKHKDLEIKVSSIWKVLTKIVPVIIAALGTIKKGLDQDRQLLSGHRSATDLQQATVMSTAQSICEVPGEIALRSGLTKRTPPDN